MIAVLAFSTQCRACCQLDDKFLNQRQSLMHGDLRGLENCLMAARVWSASSAGDWICFFLATCIRGYCGPALQQTYSWPCGPMARPGDPERSEFRIGFHADNNFGL